MSSTLRIGIVGCGRVVERGYLPALRRIRDARLVAIADPVLERCHELAPGIRAHASALDLLTAGGVDAIVLATPAAAHFDDARLAAEAGLPTLIEKPPGADLEQAAAIAILRPHPWIGFNRRFDPRVQRLRTKIPRDVLLDLTVEQYHPGGSWQPYVVRDDVLLSIGPHHFDMVRWLTRSEIMRVRAAGLRRKRASPAAATARLRATGAGAARMRPARRRRRLPSDARGSNCQLATVRASLVGRRVSKEKMPR